VNRITRKVNINQEDQWKLYCELFSERQMNKYASGETTECQAVDLYAANLAASSRFWPMLAVLELALRTTLNAQLEKRSNEKGRKVHWVLDQHNEIRRKNPRAAHDLDKAREILKRTSRAVTPRNIMDELPLGFWTIIVSNRLKEIWPDLAAGFKGLESRNSQELSSLLKFFKSFRNQIGHHHVIILLDLQVIEMRLMRLAHLIDPRLEQILKTIDDCDMRAANQTTQE
jgi:hypothetical protein